MIQINLLPWREEARQIKKKQFITSLVLGCIISLLILLVFHVHYSHAASRQNVLNAMISTAISEEQLLLNEMSAKANEAMATETQLKFIMDLYNENYRAVRLLNEMVMLVPDTISVQEIKRNGNEITLTGIAKSEDDVTQLMKEITNSPYFNQPTLLSINVGKGSNENARNFNLMFEQKG